jgi:hypothetical protein
MNVQFFAEFLGIILRVPRLVVYIYQFFVTNQLKITFAQGEREEKNPLVEMTLNSKEENSEDCCPYYVQEFCLCTGMRPVS